MGKSTTATKGYEPQRLNTFNAKSKVQAKKGHSADLQGTLPTVNGVPQYGKPRNSALATVGRLQGRRGPQERNHDSDCECTTCKAKKVGGIKGQRQESLYLANALKQYPGDGMSPPGDCTPGRYAVLHGAVEAAKAVAANIGGAKEMTIA